MEAADGALAPRCVKDAIEEALFERRRDLFSELGLVFVDTTSLNFEGAGGETLGAPGYSKDHRPDLKQMILANDPCHPDCERRKSPPGLLTTWTGTR